MCVDLFRRGQRYQPFAQRATRPHMQRQTRHQVATKPPSRARARMQKPMPSTTAQCFSADTSHLRGRWLVCNVAPNKCPKLTKPNHHETNVQTIPNNHTTNTMNVFQSLSPGAHTHQQPTRIWTFVCYPRTPMEPPWDSEFGCDDGTRKGQHKPSA